MLEDWNQRSTGKGSVVYMIVSLKLERMLEDDMTVEVMCLLASETLLGLNSVWNGLLVTDSQRVKMDQVVWEQKAAQQEWPGWNGKVRVNFSG